MPPRFTIAVLAAALLSGATGCRGHGAALIGGALVGAAVVHAVTHDRDRPARHRSYRRHRRHHRHHEHQRVYYHAHSPEYHEGHCDIRCYED